MNHSPNNLARLHLIRQPLWAQFAESAIHCIADFSIRAGDRKKVETVSGECRREKQSRKGLQS